MGREEPHEHVRRLDYEAQLSGDLAANWLAEADRARFLAAQFPNSETLGSVRGLQAGLSNKIEIVGGPFLTWPLRSGLDLTNSLWEREALLAPGAYALTQLLPQPRRRALVVR
jgi:hypothetical protein